MEKRENLFKRVVKRIENFVGFIFKRQTDELPAYTEEEFDKDLEQVLDTSNDPDETLEYIGIMKYCNYTSEITDGIIKAIENGTCRVQKADRDGDTLLHMAVQKEGLEHLVVALLNNGADATKENKSGYTPIELAHSEKMKAAIQRFVSEKEKYHINVRGYIRNAIENKSIIPISDTDLDIKFPPVIIKIEDITEGYTSEVKANRTFLDGIQPYLDEDIQGDDVYVPGITEHIHLVQTVIDESKKLLHPTVPEIQKITDQQKIPTPDTSRGART